MSQILHILRKDLRRHWPEIVTSLVLLSLFTWNQPRIWVGQAFEIRFFAGLIRFVPTLLILSWAFLIVRLIQGESLVGDRQFWTTRPYEWPKLLAAKLLSILLFLHLPLLISQLVLLKLARFPVASSLPGLLNIHALLVLALVIPVVTLSAITSSVGQACIALLIAITPLIALLLLFNVFQDMDFATDSTDELQGLIFLGACSAAILTQYIYRRTRLSRLFVASGSLLIFLVILFAPYERIIANQYPLPTQNHPLPARFSLDPNLSFAHTRGEQPNSYTDEVSLEIPVQIEGLANKSVVQIRGIKLDLDLPNGEHWSSHWHSVYHTFSIGRGHDWPGLQMKKAFFNRIKDSRVRAHVSLGLNLFEVGSVTQVPMPRDRLSLPGGGRCLNDLSDSSLRCFAALQQPHPLFVVAELPNGDCPVSREATSEAWSRSPATFADLNRDSTPDLDLTPVQQFTISLSRFYRFEDHEVRLPICPGTPLLVSTPQFRYSVRAEIDLGEVNLMNYVPAYPRIIRPPSAGPAVAESPHSISQDFSGGTHKKGG